MSRNRGWRGKRNYNENQDDRYGGSSYTTYHSSSHGQPYPGYDYHSNGYYADAQPSQGYNYWRDNDQYHAQNHYQSPVNYTRSHEHANDYYHDEGSYRRRQSRRSRSPQRNYHSHAQRADSPTPYIASPLFRRRTPDTSPLPAYMKSPTPAPPPPPAEPDPAYMALSLEPSHIVDDPRASRKLLILDLNGTLLIRSQHSRARTGGAYGGIHTHSAPRLRAVQPRPYIPAFRAYLFAPETQEWLDTMVWSSAQPHSVADMVDRVFGDVKSKLVAVWDRGSLGLTKEDYHRKALTTKDLTKPWTLLPLGTNPAVSSEVDCAAEQDGLAPSIAHSAMTTLLLDDSPHKARLQPYNHVCIPEYTSSFREKDLQQFQHEKATRVHKPRQRKRKTNESIPDQTESAEILLPSSDPDPTVIGGSSAHVEQSSIPIPPAERAYISSRSSAEPYDPTILAVIGVLDEIKKQSSVAGWIQSGGLWDIVSVPEAERESIVAPSATDASIVDDLQLLADSQEVQPLTMKELRAAQRLATKQRKRAEQAASQTVLAADKEAIQTGNDESTTADISVEDLPGAGVERVGMWFSDDLTLSYWVWRGRRALDNLGIEADHGVTG